MTEFLHGLLIFILYLAPLAVIMISVRQFTKINDELFRKILHLIFLGAYVPLLFGFETWWICVIFVACLIALLFPVLLFAEKVPGFAAFVNERKSGEFTGSMFLALGVMAVSITIGWGLLGDKHLVLSAVYCWGIGDAFAAVIGKRFGKHKITWKFVDNKKSYEGSLAMLITSALSVFIILLLRGGLDPIVCLGISLVAAAASTFVELCSKGGIDTITCPAVSMLIIWPLTALLGG